MKLEAAYDTEFIDYLGSLAKAWKLPAGTLGERDKRLDHGTMVPLYFVNQYWTGYKLVRIGLSGFPLIRHYELGQYIGETIEHLDKKTVLIASGGSVTPAEGGRPLWVSKGRSGVRYPDHGCDGQRRI